MAHKILLSYTHADKQIVEQVALKLKDAFGQDQVFYAEWSIRPGDGIIDKMSEALENSEFVFFFASKGSLASGMVKLEWQNALFLAAKGKTRIIPVRVDGCDMPSVLLQILYIDMYTYGLEAAITQIVNVIQGNTSFTPQHQDFSNLTYSRLLGGDGSVEVTIRASRFAEQNPTFAFIIANAEDEFDASRNLPALAGIMCTFTFEGKSFKAPWMRPLNASLAPNLPMRFIFLKKKEATINIIDVLHQRGENDWVPVPCAPLQTAL